jgi:hypothetical protein
MTNAIHFTEIQVYQIDTINKIKKAVITGFNDPIIYGVHGGVKEFYKAAAEVECPSTLDHIVAAAGG